MSPTACVVTGASVWQDTWPPSCRGPGPTACPHGAFSSHRPGSRQRSRGAPTRFRGPLPRAREGVPSGHARRLSVVRAAMAERPGPPAWGAL